ncbi:hypothetical protein RJ641_035663 [Dillenia turbinata]|uniref:Uncharacterized protein n=1 Tax=Dillenia turbinata TaxID=194707 RepID=A0AAN8ZIR1_9MAGN
MASSAKHQPDDDFHINKVYSDLGLRWKNMLQKALRTVEIITFDYPFFCPDFVNISGGKRKALHKAEKLVKFHSDIARNAIAKDPIIR